jgi:hypothetical protein
MLHSTQHLHCQWQPHVTTYYSTKPHALPHISPILHSQAYMLLAPWLATLTHAHSYLHMQLAQKTMAPTVSPEWQQECPHDMNDQAQTIPSMTVLAPLWLPMNLLVLCFILMTTFITSWLRMKRTHTQTQITWQQWWQIPTDKNPWNTIKIWQNNNKNIISYDPDRDEIFI